MADGFPNDSDGEALRRVAEQGSDLSKPMFVNFQVAVPDETSANKFAAVARKLGYHASVYDSPECTLPWTCECSTRMVLTYEGVLAFQEELAELAERLVGCLMVGERLATAREDSRRWPDAN